MVKTFGILIGIGLAAAAQANVSFTAHAERLDKLLQDLSAATNSSLKPSQQLADQIVAVSVRDVPLDDLMAKLAEVVDGTWDRSGKTKYLVQSEAALEAHRKPLIEARKRVLADPNAYRVQFVHRRLLDVVGVDTLARVCRGANVTFSTNPGPGELPLSTEANVAFAEGQTTDQSSFVKTVVKMGWYDSNRRVTVYIEAEATRSDGTKAQKSLGGFDLDAVAEDWDTIIAADKLKAKPLRLDPLTTDFTSAFKLTSTGGPAHPPPAMKAALTRVRARLTQATEIDPLWYSSDLFISYAETTHRQFVGALPDRLTDDTLSQLLDPVSAPELAAYMKSYASVSAAEASGWLTLRPRDPDFAASSRVDRRFLNEIGAVASSKVPLTIDKFADLIVRGLHTYNYLEGTDSRVNIEDPVTIWASFDPFPGQMIHEVVSMASGDGFGLYAFWLGFTPDQRATLASGGKVFCSELSQDQQTFASGVLTNSYPKENAHEVVAAPFITYKEVTDKGFVCAFKGNYTTIVPSWVPVPVAGIDYVANTLDRSRDQPAWPYWDKLELRLCVIHDYCLTLHATNGYTTNIDFVLHDIPQPEEPIPWRKIAPELLKELQAAIDKAHVENAKERKADGTPPR